MADGGVWVKVHPDDAGGGAPGLGDWAEITAMTGDPKRYDYNDGTTDWVAFEWTDDGSITSTSDDALVDALIVGAGGNTGHTANAANRGWGGAGGVLYGAITLHNGSSSELIQVGKGAPNLTGGNAAVATQHSFIGVNVALGGGHPATSAGTTAKGGSGGCGGGGTGANTGGDGVQGGDGGAGGNRCGGGGAGGPGTTSAGGPGISLAYTSTTPKTYAQGGGPSTPNTPNSGNGYGVTNSGTVVNTGNDGVVVIRVPASKVTATGGWV